MSMECSAAVGNAGGGTGASVELGHIVDRSLDLDGGSGAWVLVPIIVLLLVAGGYTLRTVRRRLAEPGVRHGVYGALMGLLISTLVYPNGGQNFAFLVQSGLTASMKLVPAALDAGLRCTKVYGASEPGKAAASKKTCDTTGQLAVPAYAALAAARVLSEIQYADRTTVIDYDQVRKGLEHAKKHQIWGLRHTPYAAMALGAEEPKAAGGIRVAHIGILALLSLMGALGWRFVGRLSQPVVRDPDEDEAGFRRRVQLRSTARQNSALLAVLSFGVYLSFAALSALGPFLAGQEHAVEALRENNYEEQLTELDQEWQAHRLGLDAVTRDFKDLAELERCAVAKTDGGSETSKSDCSELPRARPSVDDYRRARDHLDAIQRKMQEHRVLALAEVRSLQGGYSSRQQAGPKWASLNSRLVSWFKAERAAADVDVMKCVRLVASDLNARPYSGGSASESSTQTEDESAGNTQTSASKASIDACLCKPVQLHDAPANSDTWNSYSTVVGPVADWLLYSESLDFILLAGLLGFGLLGSGLSQIVRQRAQDTTKATFVEGLQVHRLVQDVPSVVFQGLGATMVVYLTTYGTLSAVTTQRGTLDPYVLMLSCFVAAVFSEDVWQATQRVARARLKHLAEEGEKAAAAAPEPEVVDAPAPGEATEPAVTDELDPLAEGEGGEALGDPEVAGAEE